MGTCDAAGRVERSTSGKDYEDALHRFATFEESLTEARLERYVSELDVEEYYDRLERARTAIERNVEERHAFVKQWAAYVRSHDDAEWSRQQNELIESQLQRANELAKSGEIDVGE